MDQIKKRIQGEIKTLDYELKVELPKEILRAREHGDLRENAEYKAAKERQSYLQARLGQLHRRLAALSLVNLDRIPKDKVGLGSVVYLRDTDSGDEVTYELVTSEEADPASGRISPSSPIGRCLLNHEEGDEVQVKAPAGTRELEITRLVTIHDQGTSSRAGVARGSSDGS
jgi:transcription elongation factor GreA